MRTFKVALKPLAEDIQDPQSSHLFVLIKADDVNTEQSTDDKGIYFNFWRQPEGEDAFTVAIVPFDNVRYIVAEP